ncbi:vitamin K epoxide reductase family protein [Streptomyces sp. HUAS TT20]|uniref:vitamin K epoxide reductase family protein n=1 Tax=Streptomyces sp. HUAS TT20 TaxID=3447509 RepID=UPI0021DAEC7D|nr:vitamin K epoxide reductase family protein [Streptomyces sp. HUAS 15-9]UXY25560.1 vitamin K epoxide reductase family protein [Streptomyces sp. HUAS 15-9]
MTPPHIAGADRRIGWLMALTGVVGWLASLRLAIDDWLVLKDPSYQPTCNISPVVGCSNTMASWQGNLFGFPNMLLGLGAFAAVAALGIAVLAGARLHRVLWLALNAGALVGIAFAHWLIFQSLYELNRLCPYCGVIWIITIALFWYVTLHNLRHGIIPVPARGRGVLNLVLESHWLLLVAWYGVIIMLVLTRFWSYWSSLL